MDLNLTGHVALVQAASKGIGRGIALSLAREGCDLLLTARHREHLDETAAQIMAETGRRVVCRQADSGNVSEMRSLVNALETEFGRADIIVCNSGGPPAGGMKDLTPEQWTEAANLLLACPAYLLQLALPLLTKSPAPRFFVVTSSSSKQPIAGLTLSNTLRPGVIGLIKSLVDELAAERVCCHSIAPGRFETDRLAHLINVQAAKAGKTPEEIRRGMLDSIPAKRFGEVTEIGDLVAFLSSEKAGYLNGGNWLVDGGLIRSI